MPVMVEDEIVSSNGALVWPPAPPALITRPVNEYEPSASADAGVNCQLTPETLALPNALPLARISIRSPAAYAALVVPLSSGVVSSTLPPLCTAPVTDPTLSVAELMLTVVVLGGAITPSSAEHVSA